MDSGWERLGRRIMAERGRKGFPRAADLAAAAGISTRTVEIIEAGNHSGRPRETTLAKIEAALGWREGSCERIVQGGRPRDLTDPVLARVIGAWQQLSSEQQVDLARRAERYARRKPQNEV